jgi:hypothetical protein
MRKLSDVSWGILEVLFDKQPKPSRHVPKHRQVSGFQEEVSLTWRGGYSRKTRSFVMTESDIPDHGRGGINYGEPARPESRAMNFGFGVIEFALRAAHLFSKDKGAPKKESYTPFIAIAEQPAASEAKPRTHDEREKIVDTLFGTGAKSEDSKLPLAGSQAVRNVDDIGLKPGRANVPTSRRAFSLFSPAETPTPNVYKKRDSFSLPSSHRENVRVSEGLRREPLGFSDLTNDR